MEAFSCISNEQSEKILFEKSRLKMKKVYYIGWYISDSDKDKYSGTVAGNLKMHYVVDQLKESGNTPEIISFARSQTYRGFYLSKSKKSQDCQLRYLGGFSGYGRLGAKLDFIIKKVLFIFWLFFKVKSEDTIVLYHSVSLTSLLTKIRKIVRRHVILEVEEVYGYAAQGDDKSSLEVEFKTIPLMDEYILINDYLQKEFSLPKEKCVPCYGVVNIPQRHEGRFDDGKIHVVYAGTIEGRNLGASLAVETAVFLPNNYVTHILGSGKKEHIDALLERIREINELKGFETVIYHGFMSGEALDNFLFKCHIGLSTYVQRDDFANNSLPSKVITYMCHDLAVVRGTASAFKMMDISKYWTLYSTGTPEDVAKTVASAMIPKFGEHAQYLLECNNKFVSFLSKYC